MHHRRCHKASAVPAAACRGSRGGHQGKCGYRIARGGQLQRTQWYCASMPEDRAESAGWNAWTLWDHRSGDRGRTRDELYHQLSLPRSSYPHQRRAAAKQFPPVAVGLLRTLLLQVVVAWLWGGRVHWCSLLIPAKATAVWPEDMTRITIFLNR